MKAPPQPFLGEGGALIVSPTVYHFPKKKKYLFKLYICLVLLFFRFGFTPIDAGGYVKLIRDGFPKETYTSIHLIISPI